MKESSKAAGRAKRRTAERWKMLLYPALIGMPVLAVLLWLLVGLKPEPLTSEEILAKSEWSEKELTDTLARAFAPQSNRGSRASAAVVAEISGGEIAGDPDQGADRRRGRNAPADPRHAGG